MRQFLLSFACGILLLLAVAAHPGPAEARRGGGFHAGGGHFHAGRVSSHNISRNVNVNRNVNWNVNVNRNVNRRHVYHNGRRGYWRNGVWVALPLAGAAYVASCANEYNRWQSTGSSYWRDRYYQCAN